MNKHILWMIIGCGAVFLFLFLAPALGLNKGITTAIAIVAMLACHLLMANHHHKETKNQESRSLILKLSEDCKIWANKFYEYYIKK